MDMQGIVCVCERRVGSKVSRQWIGILVLLLLMYVLISFVAMYNHHLVAADGL